MPNAEHIDRLIEYALLCAAEADEYRSRRLGFIHLLKYLYLADLAHAERNGGQTFTQLEWAFHKFGPWAGEAYQEIPRALTRHRVEENRFPSTRYEQEAVRYSLPRNESRRAELERVIPFWAARAVARAVAEFGSDTPSLLHYVYATRPMLRAAPSERLVFDTLQKEAPQMNAGQGTARKPSKEWKAKHAAARLKVQKLLAEESILGELVPQVPPPRYDEVFREGIKQLGLERAEERTEPFEAEFVFSDGVWHSQLRADDDLS